MRAVSWLVAVFALAASLGSCGRAPDVPVRTVTCENAPSAVCDAQAQAAANAVGGPVADVAVACTIDTACTRAQGSGTATVTRPDGTQVTRPWSYVGDPGPQPVPVCIGIGVDVCKRELDNVIDNVPVTKHLVGIKATCMDVRCDTTSGNIEIVYAFGDGSTDTIGSSWGP